MASGWSREKATPEMLRMDEKNLHDLKQFDRITSS